jgi:hypothetical protein
MTETRARTCVLVLGMHRSGTSAIARMISLLGAGLPKKIMGASDSNEAGHWEPEALVDLNDEMLREGGSAWNDWRQFDPKTALGAERFAHFRNEIIRQIEAEFAGEALFVLKDPRICRFTPLYLDCLAAIGVRIKVVLMSRHPHEVARSLLKRDLMPQDYALRLWLRHNLDAELATRSLDRMVISYDSALSDADAATARLLAFMAPATPAGSRVDIAAARASLRGELRHHAGAISEKDVTPSLGLWAVAAHAAFVALGPDSGDAKAMATLDVLRAQTNEDLKQNGDSLAYALGDALLARAELNDMTRQRNVMIQRTRELEVREQLFQEREREFEARKRELEGRLKEVREAFAVRRRQHIIDLASTLHPDYGDKLPKQIWPWRSLHFEKRARIRKLREHYLAVQNSPLFDAKFYLTRYPDVAQRGEEPILHYLKHGSDEGRWPSAVIDPVECQDFFPELRESKGNLVLRLIALLGPVTDET